MMLRIIYDPSIKTKGYFWGRVENAETGEVLRGVRGIKWESKPGELPTLTLELIKDYFIDVRAEWPKPPSAAEILEKRGEWDRRPSAEEASAP
jgi:hypothetical protein